MRQVIRLSGSLGNANALVTSYKPHTWQGRCAIANKIKQLFDNQPRHDDGTVDNEHVRVEYYGSHDNIYGEPYATTIHERDGQSYFIHNSKLIPNGNWRDDL